MSDFILFDQSKDEYICKIVYEHTHSSGIYTGICKLQTILSERV